MFSTTPVNHPPVRAVIWDLDGIVVQINENNDAMSFADLESLTQFILALCQQYQIAIMTRRLLDLPLQSGYFDQYLFPFGNRRSDDYLPALHWLKVQPCQSVIIGINLQRLSNAAQMGMQTIWFRNPRQAVGELLPLLAESLAV
ncbi:MAG TPA: hypothetical protein VN452_03460 [Longilinea sp.]|nr:hypothetical protein [Longilinea sp.]